MAVVSVTRLHLGSWWRIVPFILASNASMRQASRASGFLRGAVGKEPGLGFWTATVWSDIDAMRAFRDSGAHKVAMPKFYRWCDEGAVVHWFQGDEALPEPHVAQTRLLRDGKLSKVQRPSAAQQSGQIVALVPAWVRPFERT